ncbi:MULTISPECIES: TetR/AcrR family transcriptional regulator [unclassified Microbacterium]|uniref:TetR/AcrR family transcriptional regulator n=1 Tax=unclassified Microbacterium TaxID=2609290 RepID=UPI00214AB277|nr:MULTISPECIES: TetR/AcrR family transcriptional regulator [unclassified Microbacterium]MCR2784010.1 TetR/AcrR family transcriptional regulator [Microbacterium sp. zg.B96]WIM15148.1 TetR/AcrR family transcriptional regulator [Microbacterium sp. zg-B96]
MSAKEQRPVASDAGLSKQRVVSEAVRLADREGVDGLSMRRLAGALGAGAMSLYHYVASKDDLLDAMIDIVFQEIEPPLEEADWQSAMRREAVSTRRVLARHPWAIALMESRTRPGPANLRHREAVTACLRKAGFSVLMATHANWLLNSYVYGHALQEASLPFDTADELADMTEDVYLPQLPPDQFPFLNESALGLVAAGYDPAEEFIFGLDLILAALEPLRASA